MKQFKILGTQLTIDWDKIEPFEAQAQKNHWQSLEQLNERGGLAPKEIYAVMNNLSLFDKIIEGLSEGQAFDFVYQLSLPKCSLCGQVYGVNEETLICLDCCCCGHCPNNDLCIEHGCSDPNGEMPGIMAGDKHGRKK